MFLHGSRRYVCRGCTSHLRLVKRELRSRLQSNKTPNTTNKQKTKQHPKPSTRFVTRSTMSAKLRKVKRRAMNSAFALRTSSSRHYVITTRNGCSAYPQQSNSFDSLGRGFLQPKCHASNEATSVKHRAAMMGVSRVLDISKRITQNQHHVSFCLQNCRRWTAGQMRLRGKPLCQLTRTSNRRKRETAEPKHAVLL